MEFNEFTKKIRKELKPLCEETAELLVNEVEKNNGCKMVGILCREDGRACTPIIYLEPYYEMVLCQDLVQVKMRFSSS